MRVGRAALDECAIRSLEEAHRDVVFDWKRILHTAGPSARPGTGSAGVASRRRPGPQGERSRKARREQKPVQSLDLQAELPGATHELLTALSADNEPAAEAPVPVVAASGPVSAHPTALEAAAGIVSPDNVARLRGRYAELMARIAERVSDAARADALRLEAESLNPDAWVTADEVRAGVAAFERQEQHLRNLLGGRRRSRRGGARHRRRQTRGGGEGPAGKAGPSAQGSDPAASS